MARTQRERAWALAGLGQLALEGNKIPIARSALREALAILDGEAADDADRLVAEG